MLHLRIQIENLVLEYEFEGEIKKDLKERTTMKI